jgi:FkbM family methyltransferase
VLFPDRSGQFPKGLGLTHMAMLSYAQNGEDVILNRLFPETGGFFIDVGANDPVDDSVTNHFHHRGWKGINIEPEPAAFARMVAGRPVDVNLNVGISNQQGVLTFYDVPHANGWSTFSAGQAANLRAQGHKIIERQIPVMTLAQVCEQYAHEPIQFLKVDAESHETEVLAGADWARWRPRVVLVESTGWVHWEPGLLASGYHFGLFDGINKFYVRDEDRRLLPKLAMMANFQDNFIPYAYHKVIQQLERQIEEGQARLLEVQGQLDDLQGRRRRELSEVLEPNPWRRHFKHFLKRHPRVHSMLSGRSRRVG